MMDEVHSSLVIVIDHIVESEMEGRVDAEDSYYPTLQALKDLLEKIEDENKYRYIKFSDTDEDDVHHCMRCKYTGDDWVEHDDFINEDESNERLCPKCYSQSYFIASDKEREGSMMDEQIKILKEMQDKGFNVITCGLCGEVNLVRLANEMFTCYACEEKQQHHDCADLFF